MSDALAEIRESLARYNAAEGNISGYDALDEIATILENAKPIDQFAVHEQASRSEYAETRKAWGPNWVLARRTKRIVDRYGEDVRCVTEREYAALIAKVHKDAGCPPSCPRLKAAQPTKAKRVG